MLAPGGQLLLAFQVGEVPLHLAEPWGHSVALDFQRRRPEQMVRLLTDAGFRLHSSTVRERNTAPAESADQAFLLAQKKG